MDEFLDRQLRQFRTYLNQFKNHELVFTQLVQHLEYLHTLIFDRTLYDQLEPILYEMEVVYALALENGPTAGAVHSARQQAELRRLAEQMDAAIVGYYHSSRSH